MSRRARSSHLAEDLQRLRRDRRQVLRLLAGAALTPLLGCGAAGGTGVDTAGQTGSCSPIPEETGGPYPGDGTNGPNVLTTSGIVRSDIRSSFGALSGTAAGVPLTIQLTLLDTTTGCEPLAGYAVYLWHCDRDGKYSLYTVAGQNYLRGVQAADEKGVVTFTSIFPGCYSGRWPHIHFEIYPSLGKASAAGNRVRTSQLALPKDACDAVYQTSGYSQSVANLAQTSLSKDMVFGDGSTLQVGTVTGSVDAGYTVSLRVGISA